MLAVGEQASLTVLGLKANHLFHSFDTKLRSWRELHPMPEEYSRPIAQNNVKELNGLIYVACGRYVESFYVYDPKVDNWMQLTSPSMAIENPILFKWKNVLNVVDEGVLTRYDPTHDTWTSVSKLILAIKCAIFEPHLIGLL